jgi:acylphosphatase
MVGGLVQGVAYRASTQREARRLGIDGYAKNLPDGRVEVLACGDEHEVNALCEWLWQGPRLAQVNDVQCVEVPLQVLHGFVTS